MKPGGGHHIVSAHNGTDTHTGVAATASAFSVEMLGSAFRRLGVVAFVGVLSLMGLTSATAQAEQVEPSSTAPPTTLTAPTTVAPPTTVTVPTTVAPPTVAEASPANDDFAAAALLAGSSGSTSGTTVDATKEPDEPDHAGNPGGASVWYSWTAPATGQVAFDTCGSEFDTLLAVYTGAALGALTTVAENDDSCELQSGLDFAATSGTTYWVALDGFNDGFGVGSGSFTLSWGPTSTPSRPANDDFAAAALLAGSSGSTSGTTVDATKEPDEPDHAGNPGGASVWYSWTAPATGQVAFDTCGSEFDTLLAVYTGAALGALTTVAENDDSCELQSGLDFAATSGTTYRIAVDGFFAGEGTFTLSWDLDAVDGGGTGGTNDLGPTTGELARTGAETGSLLVVAGSAIALGMALVLCARRLTREPQ